MAEVQTAIVATSTYVRKSLLRLSWLKTSCKSNISSLNKDDFLWLHSHCCTWKSEVILHLQRFTDGSVWITCPRHKLQTTQINTVLSQANPPIALFILCSSCLYTALLGQKDARSAGHQHGNNTYAKEHYRTPAPIISLLISSPIQVIFFLFVREKFHFNCLKKKKPIERGK